MAQVPWRVEAVEGPLTELVQVQVVTMLGVRMLCEAVDPGVGLGPDDVVHDASELAEHVEVVHRREFIHVPVVIATEHAAPRHLHAGRVRDDRLLERDLRAVGEARDHRRVLPPLLREPLLRGRVPVPVLQALDVAHHPWDQAEALDVADTG